MAEKGPEEKLTFFVYDIAIITITAPTSQGMVQTYSKIPYMFMMFL